MCNTPSIKNEANTRSHTKRLEEQKSQSETHNGKINSRERAPITYFFGPVSLSITMKRQLALIHKLLQFKTIIQVFQDIFLRRSCRAAAKVKINLFQFFMLINIYIARTTIRSNNHHINCLQYVYELTRMELFGLALHRQYHRGILYFHSITDKGAQVQDHEGWQISIRSCIR